MPGGHDVIHNGDVTGARDVAHAEGIAQVDAPGGGWQQRLGLCVAMALTAAQPGADVQFASESPRQFGGLVEAALAQASAVQGYRDEQPGQCCGTGAQARCQQARQHGCQGEFPGELHALDEVVDWRPVVKQRRGGIKGGRVTLAAATELRVMRCR